MSGKNKVKSINYHGNVNSTGRNRQINLKCIRHTIKRHFTKNFFEVRSNRQTWRSKKTRAIEQKKFNKFERRKLNIITLYFWS